MQVKRKMSGGKSAHSFYSAPGIYHLLINYSYCTNNYIILNDIIITKTSHMKNGFRSLKTQ